MPSLDGVSSAFFQAGNGGAINLGIVGPDQAGDVLSTSVAYSAYGSASLGSAYQNLGHEEHALYLNAPSTIPTSGVTQQLITVTDQTTHTMLTLSVAIVMQAGQAMEAMLLSPGTTFVGGGANLLSYGGFDVATADQNGYLSISEYFYSSPSLNIAKEQTLALKISSGSSYSIPTGQTLAASGHNFFAQSAIDLVLKDSAGRLTVQEFSSASGTLTSQKPLLNNDGSNFALASGVTVAYVGSNILQIGGFGLVAASATGQLSISGIDSVTGKVVSSLTLSSASGSSTVLAQGATIFQNASNLLSVSGAGLTGRVS